MPYVFPSVHTALEKQSPSSVGIYSERSASAMETAVEAPEERPHFLISAAPLVATVGVNSSLSHWVSLITAGALFPPIFALTKSGTCVVEWFPQTHILVTEV